MDLKSVRGYFSGFVNEPLSASEANREMIKSFKAPYGASGLEEYIKKYAWDDDKAGRTKVYLLKDKENGDIALYYSLRCGLVYDDSTYDKLSDEEKGYVDWMAESIKKKDDNNAYEALETCASDFDYKTAERLYDIALSRVERKKDQEELADQENTLNVEKSYSAIELQHFCKNASYYQNSYHGIPIGFGLFWEKIIPQIERISSLIGCEYLYLFAADKAQGEEPKKLVEHYKSSMKFSSVEDVKIVKPDYDVNCISLVQPLPDLEINRQQAWEEYSDLIL